MCMFVCMREKRVALSRESRESSERVSLYRGGGGRERVSRERERE